MREANRNSKVPQFVRHIEMVQKRSIMYYQQQKSQPFLKIVVALPTMVASCRGRVYLFSFPLCIVLLIMCATKLMCCHSSLCNYRDFKLLFALIYMCAHIYVVNNSYIRDIYVFILWLVS